MGGIGRAIAKRALGFGMRIQYYNRSRLAKDVEEALSATYASSLDELLRTSDVVSINVPLNADTRKMIGKRELELMKVGSVLVNTARGAVIDEEALIEHLQLPWEHDSHARGIFPNDLPESYASECPPSTSGYRRLRGVGLDVFLNEPKVDERILKLDTSGVTFVPHMGTWTRNSIYNMEMVMLGNIKSALQGKGLETMIPEHREVN